MRATTGTISSSASARLRDENPIYDSVLTDSGWSAWHNLGGSGRSDVTAVSIPSEGYMEIFVLGTTGCVYHKTWTTASGWLPSELGWDVDHC